MNTAKRIGALTVATLALSLGAMNTAQAATSPVSSTYQRCTKTKVSPTRYIIRCKAAKRTTVRIYITPVRSSYVRGV